MATHHSTEDDDLVAALLRAHERTRKVETEIRAAAKAKRRSTVRALQAKGETTREIAARLGISHQRVSQVSRGVRK